MFKILEEKAKVVENELQPYIPLKEPKELYELMREYPLRGGKRLRPAFCMLSCEAFGGKMERSIRSATALEVFQNWALIHDDIEDDSDLRRGKPCLHRIYGVPLAINAGDGLHVKMWEMLFDNRSILGDELTFRILDEFKRLSIETVEGQAIEINWVSSKKYDLIDEDYYRMAGKKTSWYTVTTPFRVGAIIAGADEPVIESITDFGWKLGIAFQIQDDLLNLVGEESKYGKEIAGDIAEGKRTLMLINLLNTCKKDEKAKVMKILDKDRHAKKETEIKYILELMQEYGSIEFGKRKAREFASQSKTVLNDHMAPKFRSDSAGKTISQLVDFVINREY
ncbi:MAG: polyprenyl synthetase family protein [Promethearchaeati archaeon SRVP18_Atabeyarchaeia-1]